MERIKISFIVLVLAISTFNQATCQSISHKEPYSISELKKRASELESDLKKY